MVWSIVTWAMAAVTDTESISLEGLVKLFIEHSICEKQEELNKFVP